VKVIKTYDKDKFNVVLDGIILKPKKGSLQLNKEWTISTNFPFFKQDYVCYIFTGDIWMENLDQTEIRRLKLKKLNKQKKKVK
jgi:hypothetical protein